MKPEIKPTPVMLPLVRTSEGILLRCALSVQHLANLKVHFPAVESTTEKWFFLSFSYHRKQLASSFCAYHLFSKVHIYLTGCVTWSALISV